MDYYDGRQPVSFTPDHSHAVCLQVTDSKTGEVEHMGIIGWAVVANTVEDEYPGGHSVQTDIEPVVLYDGHAVTLSDYRYYRDESRCAVVPTPS